MNIEVEELRKLTKDDVIKFLETFVQQESSKRRKLTVYVAPEADIKRINASENFRVNYFFVFPSISILNLIFFVIIFNRIS